jgi:hypothetical protein
MRIREDGLASAASSLPSFGPAAWVTMRVTHAPLDSVLRGRETGCPCIPAQWESPGGTVQRSRRTRLAAAEPV